MVFKRVVRSPGVTPKRVAMKYDIRHPDLEINLVKYFLWGFWDGVAGRFQKLIVNENVGYLSPFAEDF